MKQSVLDRWIEEKLEISLRSRDQLEEWQLERIRELIGYVSEHSAFYRKIYKNVILPESVAEFGDYPIIRAEDIKESGLQMLCVSQSEIARIVTLDTSGTTETPKRIYFTEEDQKLTVDFFCNGMKTLTEKGRTAAVLLPFQSEGSVGDLLSKGLEELGVTVVQYGLVSDLPHLVETLQNNRVETLIGIPVQILALALYCNVHKKILHLKNVLLSTDHLPKIIGKKIKNMLHCEVFNHFGMTESGLGGAIECEIHNGMHIRENDLYCEILHPKTGEKLPDGEYGELVITTLTRKGMPLIRYATGDYTCISKVKCECGSFLMRLFSVTRRMDEGAWMNGCFLTLASLDELVFSFEGIIDYDVVYYMKSECVQLVLIHLNQYSYTPMNLIFRELKNLMGIQEKTPDLQIQYREITDIIPGYKGKRKLQIK